MASQFVEPSTRVIRGIQFTHTDLTPLLRGHEERVPGTTLNAFGAWLQDSAGPSKHDFCILSSWLPALVNQDVPSKTFYGSIESHILAAGGPSILASRRRWAIPLCGGDLEHQHWVLGWVDFSAKSLGIYDSMPEIASCEWAQPLLLKTLNEVLQFIGHPRELWTSSTWANFTVISPNELQRQMDTWSCGLFVVLAMQEFSFGNTSSLSYSLGEANKEDARQQALDALLSISIFEYPMKKRKREHGSAQPDTAQTAATSSSSTTDARDSPTAVVVAGTACPSDAQLKPHLRKPVPAHTTRPQAGPHGESDNDSDGNSTDKERSPKRPRASTSMQGPKRSAAERKRELAADEWVHSFNATMVVCAGCRKQCKLDKKREFALGNWMQHKTECEFITGKHKVRQAVKLGNTKGKNDVSRPQVRYTTKTTSANQSIFSFFGNMSTPPQVSQALATASGGLRPRTGGASHVAPARVLCKRLRGESYSVYIYYTSTRTLGGVSFAYRARIKGQLFPYKYNTGTSHLSRVPSDGNLEIDEKDWTSAEQHRFDRQLQGFARWIVDFNDSSVRSTSCEGNTQNASGVCNKCEKLAKDESLKHAIRRARYINSLPIDQQQAVQERREKYMRKTMTSTDGRNLQALLADPIIRGVLMSIDKGDRIGCFLRLYQQAKDGLLTKYETFTGICQVISDRARREAEPNAKQLLHGMWYSPDLWNFFTLMRSYGGDSAQQYSILAQELGFPSLRSTRNFVKNSDDALQSGALEFENVARVKRFLDAFGLSDVPLAVGSDCTKVRVRLSYSNDQGCHILGSTLPLSECVVEDADDIDALVRRVEEEKAFATQTRAIMIKVAVPQVPPMVVALLPTTGSDTAEKIHELHVQLLKMASQLKMPILVYAADGASSELNAQALMDALPSEKEPLAYQYPLYGLSLRAPVFEHTGPLLSVQDPSHARKTARNQPQHGTHTASLGRGVLVNRSLVDLCNVNKCGLRRSDVEKVDKQDDGAARRLFHSVALEAMTYTGEDGVQYIKDEFIGMFVYLYILGELFDAWLCRRMAIGDRILAALRARFFLHIWRTHIVALERRYPDLYSTVRSFISGPSFKIFNRLCDTLVLLALAYSQYYPDQPFCPWLLGTDFVEHFFGLARRMLPNFTFAELLKLVKHIMLRQKILLTQKSGTLPRPEREAKSGYILDFDSTPLSPEELKECHVKLTTADLNALVELAAKEAEKISRQLLHMKVTRPSVKHPWVLAALGIDIITSHKTSGTHDTDSDSESDWETDPKEDLHDDSDNDDLDPTGDNNSNSQRHLGDTTANFAMRLKGSTQDCARYAALCEDYNNSQIELEQLQADTDIALNASQGQSLVPTRNTIPDNVTSSKSALQPAQTSAILDQDGRVSVSLMLRTRQKHQSGTAVKSERVIALDPKYALSRLDGVMTGTDAERKPREKGKMSVKEASHRVRIAQVLHGEIQREKTAREHRYETQSRQIQRIAQKKKTGVENIEARNINQETPLQIGCFVIMRNDTRTYIGEILDIYKQVGGRHGSIDSAESIVGLSGISLRCFLPVEKSNDESDSEYENSDSEDEADHPTVYFSCHIAGTEGHLHTYARPSHILYNLGRGALAGDSCYKSFQTASLSGAWHLLTSASVRRVLKGASSPKQ